MSRRALIALLLVAGLGTGLAGAAEAQASPDTWGHSVRLDQRFARVDGVRTAYAVLGPATPVPLLLLNGTGSPMSQWDPALLDGLARSRRVVVYDYPGLGASARLPGTLTFDALADHADALLAALGVPRADVLGWSMGGFVAQRMAVRHAERVRSLVLAGTNPGSPRTVLGPPWVQREDSDPDASARQYVRTNYPLGARHRGWAFVRRVNGAIDAGRYPPDRVPTPAYDAMVAAEDPWLASGLNLSQLRRLDLPTLVITGAQDVVTPAANSRLLGRSIPGARVDLVEGAGHSFLFQAPARTGRTIEAFLAAQVSRRR